MHGSDLALSLSASFKKMHSSKIYTQFDKYLLKFLQGVSLLIQNGNDVAIISFYDLILVWVIYKTSQGSKKFNYE